MTRREFATEWLRLTGEDRQLFRPECARRYVEHVTIVGDGEDFHSSDSARALLEVGYWGTLDVESVS